MPDKPTNSATVDIILEIFIIYILNEVVHHVLATI